MSQETGKVGMTGETPPALNNVVHSGKRLGMTGILPRRGGRKKTLSLNPEEREALENLIEEVIIDGGMGDSESASSDEEDGSHDQTKDKLDAARGNMAAEMGSDPKALAFKMSKKFYPGQLKVALKHMTDLPPRFSRKLKKAEKYLELSSVQKKTPVSTSIKEEDEEEVLSFNNSNPSVSVQDCQTSPVSPKQQLQNDKTKTPKEKMQKDLKKSIRILLTDLDQYVDERDRTSISLDLPGAVSCADLERETLGYPVKTPESVTLTTPSSPNAEGSATKAESLVGTSSNDSSNQEKPKNLSASAKSCNHFVQPSTPKSFSAPVSAVYVSGVGSKVPAVENPKHPAISDKSAFHQYSNVAPSNFIDGAAMVMTPVQSMLPPIDFSVPPPTTFQYPAQYAVPPSRDNFMQGKVQFQPQFGFMELPAPAPSPAHQAAGLVGTAPIIFQQYNALPMPGQAPHVQALPYANSPGYYVGRFECPRPMNYVQPFPAHSPHAGVDSVPKAMADRQLGQMATQQRHQGPSNPGNFRCGNYRMKSTNHASKVDSSGSRNKPRNVRPDQSYYYYYSRQDASKNVPSYGEISSQKVISSELLMTESSNFFPPQTMLPTSFPAIEGSSEAPESESKTKMDPISPTTTRVSSTNSEEGKSNIESTNDVEAPSSTFESERAAAVEPLKSPHSPKCDSTTPDLDLAAANVSSGVVDGRRGLEVVLGERFVCKLNEMFLAPGGGGDRAKGRPATRSVFLSADVLKEIFASLPSQSSSSSSSPVSLDNFERQ